MDSYSPKHSNDRFWPIPMSKKGSHGRRSRLQLRRQAARGPAALAHLLRDALPGLATLQRRIQLLRSAAMAGLLLGKQREPVENRSSITINQSEYISRCWMILINHFWESKRIEVEFLPIEIGSWPILMGCCPIEMGDGVGYSMR